jgi:hypothetical protein
LVLREGVCAKKPSVGGESWRLNCGFDAGSRNEGASVRFRHSG